MNPVISAAQKKRYLERRGGDLRTLVDALKENDYEAFQSIGHQLRGNAAIFGFADLTELGETLERAGEGRDPDLAQSSLETLKQWLAQKIKIND